MLGLSNALQDGQLHCQSSRVMPMWLPDDLAGPRERCYQLEMLNVLQPADQISRFSPAHPVWQRLCLLILVSMSRRLCIQVTSLQQQCAELERENALLERQAVKARNLGLAVSLQASASSTPGSDLAAAIAAQTSGANIASQSLGSWARASSASAASSGPRAELTAADLAAGGMIPGPGSSASRPSSAQLQAASSGADTDSDEPSEQVTTVTVRPAAAGQQRKGGSSVEFRSSAVAGKPDQSWIKKAADENSDDGHAESGDRIAAYRPEAQEPLPPPPAVLENVTTVSRPPAALAASTPPAQTTATASHAGQISKDAAAQLKSLIVEVAATPLELLEGEYKEFCDDWDLPFDLKPEEHEWFHELLPHDVPGRMGLLTTTPHSPDVSPQGFDRLWCDNKDKKCSYT